ncbi:aminoglycoside adenylyltransferase domain-containing protein [Cryptosporangium japonicum]|uniref:Adenylyltransferase AadA C-terminal domain-containing protein n=1 Tax=Cryptosporangium japonicum TaxID=80872 RepID=A0ABP3ERJ3_9ACTN
MTDAELDAFLAGFVSDVRGLLGGTFVGAYVQGSFALGAGDRNSDCDVVVATTTRPTGPIESGLRLLHAGIPDRPGFWSTHLEASYADVDTLRAEARAALPNLLAETRTWAPFDVAWTQRYLVSTYCRLLYTLRTARVASKRGALDWAHDTLDPVWRPLLTQVRDDRALGWEPDAPPRPGSLDATYDFAAYAESFAR